MQWCHLCCSVYREGLAMHLMAMALWRQGKINPSTKSILKFKTVSVPWENLLLLNTAGCWGGSTAETLLTTFLISEPRKARLATKGWPLQAGPCKCMGENVCKISYPWRRVGAHYFKKQQQLLCQLHCKCWKEQEQQVVFFRALMFPLALPAFPVPGTGTSQVFVLEKPNPIFCALLRIHRQLW